MMPLRAVLWFKIGVTVLLWALPLLFAPRGVFRRLGFPDPGPAMVFMRLLGAAFVALLVAYVQGLGALGRGESTADTVAVGAVSNGLACLVILLYGVAGAYADWGRAARAYMWISALATGLVTLGLLTASR
jgi:hypothetical protein